MHFSNPIDANIVRKALNEVEALYTAADCGMSYLALRDKFQSGEAPNTFWFHTQSALMGSFVINWCKLFGMDVKDPYWKQTTIEQKAFREAVYQKTGFNYQAWDKYRKAMSDLKAVVVDHLNPYFPIDQLPDFQPAIGILEVTHGWLQQVITELEVEADGPVSDGDYFKKVADDIEATLSQF